MDEQKLTDWFPPEVLPARPGWYQRDYSARSNRSAWLDFFDGQNWFIGYNWCPYKDPHPVPLRWRGLAEPPLTDWFDPDTLPEREGVYEIDESDHDGRVFSHWDGKRWGYARWEKLNGGVQGAIANAVISNRTCLSRRWRGLAVQP